MINFNEWKNLHEEVVAGSVPPATPITPKVSADTSGPVLSPQDVKPLAVTPKIKPWKAGKEQIMKYWKGLAANLPVILKPIEYDHEGTTIQEDGICTMTISPAPHLSVALSEKAQKLALDVAAAVGVVGVMAVELFVKGDQLFINELAMRPHNSGHWTIDGSHTSQFEQHLRAVLDLPLGDPSMSAPLAVMGNVLGGDKPDMYRPYLHLMARTPALKFHHYKKEVRPGRKIGHVTMVGENLVELTQEVQHALDYMSGEVDE